MKASTTHLIHGFKTALAAMIAYAVTSLLGLEFAYWAVITTVIVMQVYVADSIEMCLYRFSGTMVGAALGALVILITPKTEFFVGLALFITIGVCSFLTRYKTRYRMAAITVVIVVMTGLHTDNIILFSLARVGEIFIGILCAFAVSVTVFPRRRSDALASRLESQATDCAAKCDLLVKAFLDRQQNVDYEMMDDLVRRVWDNHALLQKIHLHESLIYREKLNQNFSDKVALMSSSVEHLRNMVRTLNSLSEVGHDIIMAREFERIAKESGKTLIAVMQSRAMPLTDDLEYLLTALDTKLSALRNQGLVRRFDSKRLIQVFSFYSSLVYFAEDVLSAAKKDYPLT